MLSETGYYLSSLEMSAEYIKRLDPDNLNIVECSTVDGLPGEVGMLLLPDCRAVDILCLGDKSARYFERMEREVLLKGYEMVTSLDMVRDSSRSVFSNGTPFPCKVFELYYTLCVCQASPNFEKSVSSMYLHFIYTLPCIVIKVPCFSSG